MKVISAKIVPTPKPTATAAKSAATSAVVLKKDGTPDKRYNNAATAIPLKKTARLMKNLKAIKKLIF